MVAPQSPFGEERLYGLDMDMNTLGGVAGMVLLLLLATCFGLLQLAKWRRERQDPADRASVAQGKHPNVASPGRPMPLIEEISYHNEAFSDFDVSATTLYGKQGLYTKKEDMPHERKYSGDYDASQFPNIMAPGFMITESPLRMLSPLTAYKGRTHDKSISKSISFTGGIKLKATDVNEDLHAEDDPTYGQASKEIQLKSEHMTLKTSRMLPPLQAVAFCEPSVAVARTVEHRHVQDKLGGPKPTGGNAASMSWPKEHTDSEDDNDNDDYNDADDDGDYKHEEEVEEVENPYKSLPL